MFLALIFSILAFADCKNPVDCSDIKKMIAYEQSGGPHHGKVLLACTTKSCGCIDGVVFEYATYIENADGSCSLGESAALKAEYSLKVAADLEKEKAMASDLKEMLEKYRSEKGAVK